MLIVEHSEEGALGLVLNRPSETTVGEAVSELGELLDVDDPLYVGGPVQPSSLIVLAQFDRPDQAALIAFEDIGVLAGGAADDPVEGVRRGRGFVGHAGWGPGQLDSEMERGDWILEPAQREDAFTAELLTLAQVELLNFLFEEPFRHRQRRSFTPMQITRLLNAFA